MLENIQLETKNGQYDESMYLSENTLRILEKLGGIYGLAESQSVFMNYAMNLRLSKLGKVDVGNYNIVIRNKSNYDSTKQVVELVKELLLEEQIINTTYRYVTYDELTKKQSEEEIIEQLLIIDSEMVQKDFIYNKNQIIDFLNKYKDKIFILIDNGRKAEGLINANYFDYITWSVTVECINKNNKKDYIEKVLMKNKITVAKNCTFVDCLSEEPFWMVKDKITNMILECKTLGITKITDNVLTEILECEYCKEKSTKSKNPLKELDKLIGMNEVKEQVKQIINYITVNKKRGKMPMLHMCFLGNPGTGKTTVARIIGDLFSEMKILSNNPKFVEAQRADLIGRYVGETAPKTLEKINSADGGVLFIDEAYSITTYMKNETSKDFGSECIATLMKEMEDRRNRLCVILAGYTNEMNDMLKANPGFESRIQFKINFPDYTAEELYEIFKKNAKDDGYKLQKNIKRVLIDYFEEEKKKDNFSNARCVRNIFEKIKFEQATRITNSKNQDINMIYKEDITKVVEKNYHKSKEKARIGFLVN